MSVLHIPCPKCRKELKLKDPSLLGKKAKCPACNHRFLLEWRSHDSAAESPPPPAAATQLPANESQRSVPTIDTDSEGEVGRLREMQRRRTQRRNRNLIVVAVCLILLGGGYFLARPYLPAPASERAQTAATSTPQSPQTPDESAATTTAVLASWDEQLSPTDGEPIELRMVPSGVRLIVNLRPAQLWSDDLRMAELRASLTQDVTGWLEQQLRTVTRHEPRQIEEVLLAWILGSRGTPPQLSAVVHLKEEARMSDLLDEFGSEALDEFAQPKVYVKGDRATLILNTKTFAIAPREYGAELPEWVDTPDFKTRDGIASLLSHTDRERLATVVFEPADVQRHLQQLVSEPVRPMLTAATDWFASEAETVAWSLHAGEEFHSEILVRGPRTTSSLTTEAALKQNLEALPHTMVGLIQKMNPPRRGFRQLIGRFPAMLEVSRLATISSIEDRMVRLLTVMPPKAAPNLALGAVLTWDESTRTDFSADAPQLVTTATKLPETVLERLQLPVDAEFNRVPLQEALDYIGQEIHVGIEIDGDALKDAGFTKNMAQTFTLGKVPAAKALKRIVDQYKEPGKQMVIVLDEARQTLIVLTKKFADQRGLDVHSFGS